MALTQTEAQQFVQQGFRGDMRAIAKALRAVVDGDFLGTLDSTELGYLDGVTAGAALVSKALVLDANGNIIMPATGMFGLSRAALAAAGTTSADAAVIATQVVAVTAADGTTGVALPAAATTEGPILVINTVLTGGADLKVYPVDGGNDLINGEAEDAEVLLGPGAAAWFIPTSATQWYVSDRALAGLTKAELEYLNIATLGTGAASKAVVLDSGEDYTWPAAGILTYGVLKDPAGTTLGATVAELNGLDNSATELTAGSGIASAESYGAGTFRNGSFFHTRLIVDLTGLVGSAADLDIIGDTGGAANANFGQITAAKSGTLVAGQVTCIETPAGGADDIDFYSATVATGAQDVDVTTLTETALLTRGAAWAAGDLKPMTLLPTANDYLYIVNGEAVGGTYTAGKFLIELFGKA